METLPNMDTYRNKESPNNGTSAQKKQAQGRGLFISIICILHEAGCVEAANLVDFSYLCQNCNDDCWSIWLKKK